MNLIHQRWICLAVATTTTLLTVSTADTIEASSSSSTSSTAVTAMQQQQHQQHKHLRRTLTKSDKTTLSSTSTTPEVSAGMSSSTFDDPDPNGDCNMDTCIKYDTFVELVAAINDEIMITTTTVSDGEEEEVKGLDASTTGNSTTIVSKRSGAGRSNISKKTICICPYDYSPEDSSFVGENGGVSSGGLDTCGNDDKDPDTNSNNDQDDTATTLMIPSNVELTLICSDKESNCYFGCRETIFQVEGGLNLYYFSLSGGRIDHEYDLNGEHSDYYINKSTQSRIYVSSTGSLALYYSNIQNTETLGRAGAIYNNGGSILIQDTILSFVYANLEGGGIYATSGSDLQLYNSMILKSISNVAGGGLYLSDNTTTYIQDTRFNFNESPLNTVTTGLSSNPADIYVESSKNVKLEGCGELLSSLLPVEDGSSSSSPTKSTTIIKTGDGDVVATIEPCNKGTSSSSSTASASMMVTTTTKSLTTMATSTFVGLVLLLLSVV